MALSVAAALAIFLLYVSVAGGTPSIQPSQLHGRKGEVALVGKVTGSPDGDAHSDGLRFRIRNCLFPAMGLYWIQFWFNKQMLVRRALVLR